MANFSDKLGNFISETAYGISSYPNSTDRMLKGFYATDKPLDDFMQTGATNVDQVLRQVVMNKKDRNFLFEQIDVIRSHHLATTIKDVIIDDCFNSMCDKNLVTIQYRSSTDETNKMFNKDIASVLEKTSFLEIFKDCLINEGIDYGEMFLTTKCVVGEGIVEICDDIDLHKHIAIYKNLSPVGYIRFNGASSNVGTGSASNQINPEDYIAADNISHFLINPKKINLEVNYEYNKSYNLPEKIRCAEPILTPVIDLIVEYNSLEKVRTAIELNKALAPILLGVGINSSSDMTEIRKQLQQYSISINQTRNAVLNNLNNLNVNNLLANMNPIKLIPYDTAEGTNSINQIKIDPVESDLTEKLNDMKKCIAQAVGIPEEYLASSNIKEAKEQNIASNARYSRMLSGIQQSLARGIVEFIYKHLRYKYTKLDINSKPYLSREIIKNCIEVKFKSITNIDDRLNNEQMLLTANSISELAGIIDVIVGSPNLPVTTDGESVLKLWRDIAEPYPYLRDIFKIDPNHEQNLLNNNNPEAPPEQVLEQPKTDQQVEQSADYIKDIFK